MSGSHKITPEQRAELRNQILSVLRKRGPITTTQISDVLGLYPNKIAFCLRNSQSYFVCDGGLVRIHPHLLEVA